MGNCGQTHQDSAFHSHEEYMDPQPAGSHIPLGDRKVMEGHHE